MKTNKVRYDVINSIAVIKMDCADNLNAIDEAMADELLYCMQRAETDTSVKVIVLKGLDKAFSSGGDIRYFYNEINSSGGISIDSLIEKVDTLAYNMKKMDKLIVAAVKRTAAGAGVSLALGCDYIFCSDDAVFLLAFVNIGLVPDTGAVYLLAKSIGAVRTMEIAASGRPVYAKEARELGLVRSVVPAQELDDAVMDFAEGLCKGPYVSYKNIKKQIFDAVFYDYRQWLDNTERPTQRECASTADFSEGVTAFVEKRKAVFGTGM